MAEIVKDYHSAAGNIVVESIRGIGRNQAVSASPDNEGRQFQLRNAVGETGWTPSPTLDDRPAISFAPGELTRANHQLQCNFARIAIDITQTLLHEAPGKVFLTIQSIMGNRAK